MQYQVIHSQIELNKFVSNISQAQVVALDTEFMRRRTLYPEVALIQVFAANQLALIDPLLELDFTVLWDVFKNPNILKILHSPSEDIEVFQKFAGFVPNPIFDTQFALQVLGKGNCIGFANMVKTILEVEIDKSESRTNWLQRPLTQKQLDYAASDVFYLMPCFEHIYELIKERDLVDIVIKESELIASKRAFSVPDDQVYLDIKNAWQLKSRDLAVLKELAAWRRAKAHRKNLALSFVLKEHTMVEIAKRRPTSLNGLRSVPGIETMEVNRSGKEIVACIEKGRLVSEPHCPKKLLRLIDYPEYKKAAKQLTAHIKQVADDNEIPADVLASKKQINQLISWNWKKTAEERASLLKPDLLQPWRYEMVKLAISEWDV
ncbi:Ribonuclease D [Pseudoalteromonas holothuriae]|uniref:Ribonuclease D n=1 Tax=Pseudoalteromonas holothuriae TaxID=2963714 RepID=A0A9W4R0T7_9GAMM|nr:MULTISPECIES: ribonuclease D [unclassified Pseudoalteromonas]CAH9050956.1 Ribonuclease D [Pseudoalteromonas sp. CIP111951]CAH9061617.1 Ribonuclease D [Pseudoalteromonas sp. CIP111854]